WLSKKNGPGEGPPFTTLDQEVGVRIPAPQPHRKPCSGGVFHWRAGYGSCSPERTVGVGDDVSEHTSHVDLVHVGGVGPVGVGAAPGVDVLAVDYGEVVAS